MKPRKQYLHVRSGKQVSSIGQQYRTQNSVKQTRITRSMIVDSWMELRKFR